MFLMFQFSTQVAVSTRPSSMYFAYIKKTVQYLLDLTLAFAITNHRITEKRTSTNVADRHHINLEIHTRSEIPQEWHISICNEQQNECYKNFSLLHMLIFNHEYQHAAYMISTMLFSRVT
jgi:hypothetical protein